MKFLNLWSLRPYLNNVKTKYIKDLYRGKLAK